HVDQHRRELAPVRSGHCRRRNPPRYSHREVPLLMRNSRQRGAIARFAAVWMAFLAVASGVLPLRAHDAPQPPQQPQYRMRVTSELVLVNVVARDRHGNLIRDLKKEDFTLTEDGKKQDISTFDFENVDALATAGASDTTVTGAAASIPNAGLLHSSNP